jgi:hypothetical protein
VVHKLFLNTTPGPGGSGGGAGGSSTAICGGAGNTPPTSPPQGNDGGKAPNGGFNAGGGGGATAAGHGGYLTLQLVELKEVLVLVQLSSTVDHQQQELVEAVEPQVIFNQELGGGTGNGSYKPGPNPGTG